MEKQPDQSVQTKTSVYDSGMDFIRLEKPDFKSIDTTKLLQMLIEDTDKKYLEYMREVSEPKYLYWDKIQHKVPPSDLNTVESWYMIKQLRKLLSRPTPIKTEDGKVFTWVRLASTDEYLHIIDMHTGGQIFAPYEAMMENTKQKYVSRGIIEEAIASSQLEGATTTGPVAKKMLLENRPPRNESETMILNNYKTMKAIDEDFKNKEMTEDLLFEMHRMLTQDQLDPTEQLRYRKDEDKIIVGNATHIAHVPPKEDFLQKEMKRLIEYVNDQDGGGFIHPVIKAIFIHFWIGYLHPFTDGNGRLARGLFYWYLLRKKYWTFMYLPISSAIKRSADSYSNAYIYSEQDDQDLTYFYDYHIRKILQSIDEFAHYLDKVVKENREIDKIIGQNMDLNDRQKQALHHLIAEGSTSYATVNTHMVINRIGRITARKDLIELEAKSFVKGKKVGKVVRYYPTNELFSMTKNTSI